MRLKLDKRKYVEESNEQIPEQKQQERSSKSRYQVRRKKRILMKYK